MKLLSMMLFLLTAAFSLWSNSSLDAQDSQKVCASSYETDQRICSLCSQRKSES